MSNLTCPSCQGTGWQRVGIEVQPHQDATPALAIPHAPPRFVPQILADGYRCVRCGLVTHAPPATVEVPEGATLTPTTDPGGGP